MDLATKKRWENSFGRMLEEFNTEATMGQAEWLETARGMARDRIAAECDAIQITSLRAQLGLVCKQVAASKRPMIVRCHNQMEVALVPLAEWCALVQRKTESQRLLGDTPGELDA